MAIDTRLRKFSKSEVVLNDMEAWQVLVFFFGGNAGTTPRWLTPQDRAFAQALLVKAVDASKQLSWIQELWSSTANPSTGVRSVLRSLATKAARDWLASRKPEDFKDAKIYTMVKNELTRSYRSTWQIRIDTDELIY